MALEFPDNGTQNIRKNMVKSHIYFSMSFDIWADMAKKLTFTLGYSLAK